MSRLPFELSIPTPCTQDWSDMSGSAAQRHCASCDKKVYNLAALSPRQIEQLVQFSNGNLCARITRDAESSIIAAPDLPQLSFAGIAFAASLSFASIAAAQSPKPKAIVTGTIADRLGRSPTGQPLVTFSQGGAIKAMIKADQYGVWRAELDPGTYDVKALLTAAQLSVNDVLLHSGEQSFGVMRTQDLEEFITVGDVATKISPLHAFAYRLRHPIRYISYLYKRYL